MEDWAMIKLLHRQGVPKSRIASELGVDRKTVDRALAEDKAKEYQRRPAVSKLDPFKEHIVERLNKYDLTATKLFQEIKEQGYTGSYDTVKRYAREVRPPRPKEAFVRFETEPGEQTQVDWASFGLIRHQGQMKRLYCFSLLLCYSRFLYIEFTVSQSLQALLQCHINGFNFIGGVTRFLLYDNMKTVVLSRDGRHIKWNSRFLDFAHYYGFIPSLCAPYRKETKGKVESSVDYVKENCFKGREFTDIDEAVAFLKHWLETIANVRIHGTTKRKPAEVFHTIEKAQLKELTAENFIFSDSAKATVHINCHLSYKANYYSVPFQYIGMELDVIEVNNLVKIYFNQKEVALHTLCTGEKGKHITNKDHYPQHKNITLDDILSRQRKEMAAIGQAALAFFDEFAREDLRKYDYRIISGILALRKKYRDETIDAACARAAYYGSYSYTTVRKICEKDLTMLPVHENETYINEQTGDLARDLGEYALLSELGAIL
jgi:transposase